MWMLYLGLSDYSEAWAESQFEATPNLDEMSEGFWRELKPLYKELHAYIRHRLGEFYADYTPSRPSFGFKDILTDGAIPAHLLGKDNCFYISYDVLCIEFRLTQWHTS